ncbi:MAG: NAD(P)/FAD-dependent oxidoreductase [Minisyncoccales bacterium]
MFDLIIIGAGPAGTTAAIYGKRQKLKTLIITKDFEGQIGKKPIPIQNWPGNKEISGPKLMNNFKEHLKDFNVEIKEALVKKIKKSGDTFKVKTKEAEYESKSVIIASGSDPRPLEVPGEKKYIGKGVSYCAICDGSIYQDENVVVVGGGDAGLETVTYLKDIAKKIYVLEFMKEIKAKESLKERVKKLDNVEIITGVKLKKIKGDKFVNSVVYEERESKEKKELKVEGVFVQVGYQPATAFISDLVEFNKKDEIKVDPWTGKTKTKGLYAAGDVTNVRYNQLVIAAGMGATAALSAFHYLNEKE